MREASCCKVEVVNGFDESFDDLFECVAASVPCVPEKDAAFLRWRYGTGWPPHPRAKLGGRGGGAPGGRVGVAYPVTIFGVREGGDPDVLLGYAVLRVGAGGDNGYLLDLTVRPGRDDVAWSLLRESIAFFERAGVYIIRYRFATSPTSPQPRDLRGLGFFPRPGRAHALMVKFADNHLQEAARDLKNWSYSLGDGEASFWVT